MAFDNSPFRYGAQPQGYAGSQVEVDQGLRTFMLGVYNNMVIGLGISGLVALGLNMAATAQTATGKLALTPFGQNALHQPAEVGPHAGAPRVHLHLHDADGVRCRPRPLD